MLPVTNSYSVDVHPQMGFQQPSATEGRIYKPENYRSGSQPQPVEVTTKTLEHLRVANKIVWDIRDNMGIKAGNQWLDVFPDGKSRVQDAMAKARYAQLPDDPVLGKNILVKAAKATVMAGGGSCGTMNAVAFNKLLQIGIDAPLHFAGTDHHEYPVIGDHRMGKVIKVDAWVPIPFAQVMSPQEIAETNIKITVPPNIKIPSDMFDGLPRISDFELNLTSQFSEFGQPLGSGLIRRIIEVDKSFIDEGKENKVWHELFGPGDPNTPYKAPGEMPVTFNRVPVKYWQDNIRAKQNLKLAGQGRRSKRQNLGCGWRRHRAAAHANRLDQEPVVPVAAFPVRQNQCQSPPCLLHAIPYAEAICRELYNSRFHVDFGLN